MDKKHDRMAVRFSDWLADFLYFLFHPKWWLRNYDFNKYWDVRLQELMQENKFIVESEHKAKLGETTIWIANHPYASFTPYDSIKVMPSRRTSKRAFNKLIADEFSS